MQNMIKAGQTLEQSPLGIARKVAKKHFQGDDKRELELTLDILAAFNELQKLKS
jgi:hypothetical protein